MTHYINVNGQQVDVTFTCQNPGIDNNTCPTGTGACDRCRYCQVSLNSEAFLTIWRVYKEVT